MKRICGLLAACALMLGLPSASSADPRVGADVYFGVGSGRIVGGEDRFTFQYVGANRWFDSKRAELRESAVYTEITCKRTKRFFRCFIDPTNHVRLKIDSFEIDPALESATLTAHKGNRKVDLTWTGRGDREPGVGQYLFEDFHGTRGGHFFAGAGANVVRRARLSGKLFGHAFGGSSSDLYEGVYSGGSGCIRFDIRCFTKALK